MKATFSIILLAITLLLPSDQELSEGFLEDFDLEDLRIFKVLIHRDKIIEKGHSEIDLLPNLLRKLIAVLQNSIPVGLRLLCWKVEVAEEIDELGINLDS